ncbi:hypothetical protein AB1Y20_010297 [Prymnesium parvum]|uniref:WD repeat-containing protein 75 second beta-propeller domain-containing protein n=1 Tax=Prymnesium parvum TaxID=97485 RepID=A0AB34K7Y9_PRYPA
MRNVAFSSDSKYLLCCSGCVVKLFSCATGAQLRLLVGHSDEVTAVAHSTTSVLQAFSAALDGLIIQWDLDEAVLLRCFSVGRPILAFSLTSAAPDLGFVLLGGAAAPQSPAYCRDLAKADFVYSVALRVSKRHAARAHTLAAPPPDAADAAGARTPPPSRRPHADLPLGTAERPWPADLRALFRAAQPTALAVGACGGASAVVAVLSGGREAGQRLYAHSLRSSATLFFAAPPARQLGCVCVSPAEMSVATGDDIGRIHLWPVHSLFSDEAKAKGKGKGGKLKGGEEGGEARARQLHWHAQRVSALAFSADGAYLYSAGREGVLVSWQLHSAERAFLPRLGAPISVVAPSADGASAALLGDDNAIRLVDLAANSLRFTLHGPLCARRIVPDARLRCMVLHGGGAGGRLQWWAPQHDRQLLALEVAPRNVSGSLPALDALAKDKRRSSYRRTAAAGGAALVQVELACLSADGSHIASLERRSEAELRQHICLKFWALTSGSFRLVARVSQPHASVVRALAFHPQLLLVVSASHDAKFKLWEASTTADAPPSWSCRSVGYYRQSAACAAAFSTDGSLLAVAYAPDVITLWEPLTNELLHTLSQPLPSPADELSFVAFAGQGGAMLAHSAEAIFCWDLLTGSLCWSYRADAVLSAAADSASDSFLVAISLAATAEAASTEEADPPNGADVNGGPTTEAAGKASYTILEFGTASAAADGASSVPRRVWQLARGPAHAVGFLPATDGGAGTPLCLCADGEMHTLALAEGGAAAPPLTSLASGGGSHLDAIFGSTPTQELEQLQIDVQRPVASLSTSAAPAAPGDRSSGWEARAARRWMHANLSSVPSHLLPAVTTIYPSFVHQALLGAHEAPSELRLHAQRRAAVEGRAKELKAAVAEWAPLLHRGFLTSGGRRRAVKRLSTLAREMDGAGEGGRDGMEVEAAEEELGEGAVVLAPRRKKKGGEEEGGGGGEAAAAEEGGEAISGGGEAALADAAGEWPGKGWALMDTCGIPNAGFAVSALVDAPPLVWDGTGAPPKALSAADAAFWRENAYAADELAETQAWMVEAGVGRYDAGAVLPDTLGWHALDESAGALWEAVLGSGVYAQVQLDGAGGKTLEEELREADAALLGAGIRADGAMEENPRLANGPDSLLPVGWRESLTKTERKELGKVLTQRLEEGNDAASVQVLAAALKASNKPCSIGTPAQ